MFSAPQLKISARVGDPQHADGKAGWWRISGLDRPAMRCGSPTHALQKSLPVKVAVSWTGGVILLMFLILNAGQAGSLELTPRVIILPDGASAPLFIDTSGDGRCDLFVIDQARKRLLRYRQHPDGFTNSPDQVIPLPPQTAWVALGEVDPNPGLELLMSTATGLVYFRQNAGDFELQLHTLIAASQYFTNCNFPILTSLGTNTTGTNFSIPVITEGQAVSYNRNNTYEWSPATPTPYNANQTNWSANSDPWDDPWVVGSNLAYNLRIQHFFHARPEPDPQQKQKHKQAAEAIQKIKDDLKKSGAVNFTQTSLKDVNGDGRPDLLLWEAGGKLDLKTDIYIYIRGDDQQLPQRPTQVLHGHGWPVAGTSNDWTPMHDLDGDGVPELVLLEFNTSVLSYSGLIQTALSHGLDWLLTIRTFQHGAFSRSPNASVPVKMTMPAEVLNDWPIYIQGDFNGDGRPDLLVRRTDTQWNIFLSTTDGRWFIPQPALTFDAPADGSMEIEDLNGDGVSDIIWHEYNKNRLVIFMSPSRRTAGKNP